MATKKTKEQRSAEGKLRWQMMTDEEKEEHRRRTAEGMLRASSEGLVHGIVGKLAAQGLIAPNPLFVIKEIRQRTGCTLEEAKAQTKADGVFRAFEHESKTCAAMLRDLMDTRPHGEWHRDELEAEFKKSLRARPEGQLQ